MDWLRAAIAWLDNPAVKYGLTLVGAWFYGKNPGIVRKAIPTLSLGASFLIALLHALFGDVAAPAVGAVLGGAGAAFADTLGAVADTLGKIVPEVARVPWWKWLVTNALLPVVLAWGTQSGLKNTGQWARDKGFALVERKTR